MQIYMPLHDQDPGQCKPHTHSPRHNQIRLEISLAAHAEPGWFGEGAWTPIRPCGKVTFRI